MTYTCVLWRCVRDGGGDVCVVVGCVEWCAGDVVCVGVLARSCGARCCCEARTVFEADMYMCDTVCVR